MSPKSGKKGKLAGQIQLSTHDGSESDGSTDGENTYVASKLVPPTHSLKHGHVPVKSASFAIDGPPPNPTVLRTTQSDSSEIILASIPICTATVTNSSSLSADDDLEKLNAQEIVEAFDI